MVGKLCVFLYKFKDRRIKILAYRLARKLEGGEWYSTTLREILLKYYKVDIGMYTHGGCFDPYQFDEYTTIGRYCSIARTAFAVNRNHPMDFKSTHAFFYNPSLKYCKEDKLEYTPLNIGNDVWMGHNSIIMPHVQNIGDGAVIAAGAVVNKNVPPYAIFVGNPARLVGYRFNKETIEKLLEEKWWESSIEELKNSEAYFSPFIQENNKEK